ncbi:hypothetical protein BKA70DRAFT_1323672 [Coprinopsis sp. MPI-PUGE-AT-0042]|nr:hypothetical protein BKA70DRAFT_1323672 [Coprinopsis sp. MPI-PUGE-AT-0042]
MAFELAGVWIAIAYVFLTHCTHFTLGQYLATPDDLNCMVTDHWYHRKRRVYWRMTSIRLLVPTDVRLIYCSERIENTTTCGGTCFCLPGAWLPDCNDCNLYNSCGTRLDNGFCFTPQTNSSYDFQSTIRLLNPCSKRHHTRAPHPRFPPQLLHRPPSSSRSPSPSRQSSSTLPVGAYPVAIILATILFVIWIRRRDRHQEMREANLHPPPTPFRPAGMPIVAPGRLPMPAPAPSTVSSSSSGWAPQHPKLANFGYDLSQSGPSHTANPSFSSSDASSSLAFQRPAQNPAMDIIHEDSGERIRFSLLQQGQGPVEHPPPYSSA